MSLRVYHQTAWVRFNVSTLVTFVLKKQNYSDILNSDFVCVSLESLDSIQYFNSDTICLKSRNSPNIFNSEFSCVSPVWSRLIDVTLVTIYCTEAHNSTNIYNIYKTKCQIDYSLAQHKHRKWGSKKTY